MEYFYEQEASGGTNYYTDKMYEQLYGNGDSYWFKYDSEDRVSDIYVNTGSPVGALSGNDDYTNTDYSVPTGYSQLYHYDYTENGNISEIDFYKNGLEDTWYNSSKLPI